MCLLVRLNSVHAATRSSYALVVVKPFSFLPEAIVMIIQQVS